MPEILRYVMRIGLYRDKYYFDANTESYQSRCCAMLVTFSDSTFTGHRATNAYLS